MSARALVRNQARQRPNTLVHKGKDFFDFALFLGATTPRWSCGKPCPISVFCGPVEPETATRASKPTDGLSLRLRASADSFGPSTSFVWACIVFPNFPDGVCLVKLQIQLLFFLCFLFLLTKHSKRMLSTFRMAASSSRMQLMKKIKVKAHESSVFRMVLVCFQIESESAWCLFP